MNSNKFEEVLRLLREFKKNHQSHYHNKWSNLTQYIENMDENLLTEDRKEQLKLLLSESNDQTS